MSFLYRFMLMLSIGLLCACSKQPDLVDEKLTVYLDAFRYEASLRGVMVDYNDQPLEARLQFHKDNDRLGWCEYKSDVRSLVIINTLYWEILNELEKEKLVFHELGHCVLKRDHKDDLRRDGRCRSIMHSGQHCSDDYSTASRKVYLDELFMTR